jgi:hypothetical protein
VNGARQVGYVCVMVSLFVPSPTSQPSPSPCYPPDLPSPCTPPRSPPPRSPPQVLLYHQHWLLRKSMSGPGEECRVSFTVPIAEPLPPQYFVRLVSDRWLGCEAALPISFRWVWVLDLGFGFGLLRCPSASGGRGGWVHGGWGGGGLRSTSAAGGRGPLLHVSWGG